MKNVDMTTKLSVLSLKSKGKSLKLMLSMDVIFCIKHQKSVDGLTSHFFKPTNYNNHVCIARPASPALIGHREVQKMCWYLVPSRLVPS